MQTLKIQPSKMLIYSILLQKYGAYLQFCGAKLVYLHHDNNALI